MCKICNCGVIELKGTNTISCDNITEIDGKDIKTNFGACALTIENCPNLKRIVNLDGVDILNILNCGSLEEIRNIWNNTEFSCKLCGEVRLIENFTGRTFKMGYCKKITLDNINCDEKIYLGYGNRKYSHLPFQNLMRNVESPILALFLDNVKIEQCNFLHVSMHRCKNVELSAMSELTNLTIHQRCNEIVFTGRFPELKTLSIRSKIKKIRSISLPDCPKLQRLTCINNDDVTEIKNFPLLKTLNCSGCSNLRNISNLPKLESLDCSYCPLLLSLPETKQSSNTIGCKWLRRKKRDTELVVLIQRLYKGKYRKRKMEILQTTGMYDDVLRQVLEISDKISGTG